MELEVEQGHSSRDVLRAAMHRDLHDLCQPLTALRCQLEVGRMLDNAAALREAVDSGLTETRRLFAAVARMRASLLEEDQASQSTKAK